MSELSENTYEQYVEQKKNEIKEQLARYIELSGLIITNNKFSCPNKAGHAFGDRHPSANMTIGKDNPYWHCFVCGAGGDTFNFAYYNDGLPNRGIGFIDNTIPTLAEKLGIEWKPETVMSESMLRLKSMYDINEKISKAAVTNLLSLIDSQPDHPIVKYVIEERQLTRDDVIRFELGFIDCINDAVSIAHSVTPQTDIHTEVNITATNKALSSILCRDSLLFILRSISGHAVGYAARKINYGKPGYSGPKYINSPTNRIFLKGHFLYGLNDALPEANKVNNLYIVEGYMDYISCVKHGIPNVVALCGTAFSEKQLDTLYSQKIQSVTFCLDGDEAGARATYNTLVKLFMFHKIITPFVIRLPENMDPDTLLKQENGIDTFKALRKYNLIEYRIITVFKDAKNNMMENIEEEIAEFFAWLISYEPNHIKRLKALDLLSDYTGFGVIDLRKQLDYQDKMLSDDTTRKIDGIWFEMLRDGRANTIKNRIDIIDKARHDLVELTKDESERDIIQEQIHTLDDINITYKQSNITQVKTGWSQFDEHVMIPKDASVIIIGAYPNVGKSILMRNLALNIIEANSDLGVIYFTLDDPLKQTIPAMIAKRCQVNINDIRFQNLIAERRKQQILNKIEHGFNDIKTLVNDKRLAIFDQGTVSTMGDIQTHTEIIGEEMSKNGLKPVVFIDSLHSIKMQGSVDRRLEVMSHIRDIRRIANINCIPVFGVGELRKGDSSQGKAYRRAHLRDLSETGDIEYRITVGIILENQLKEKGVRYTTRYWHDESVVIGQPLPILSLHVDKNKEGYFQGEICYKVNPFHSHMMEITEAEVQEIDQTNRPNVNNASDVNRQEDEDTIRLTRASGTRR